MIEARELGKVYKVNHKQPGLKGAFANLFHAKWEQKVAVDGAGLYRGERCREIDVD